MSQQPSRINQFRRRLWACLAIYWFALLLAIHWPMPFHRSHFVTADDKVVHFVLYGGLALVLLPVTDFLFPAWPAWKRAAGVVAAVAVQGIFDELTQPLTQRTTDVLDLVADICGAIVAVLVYRAGLWRILPTDEGNAAPPP
jgi:VanZ family protein